MPNPLVVLEEEWAALARSPEGRSAPERWSAEHPVFAGAQDLEGVLRRRRNPELAPELLAALAALAPGDLLAARTLLQAVVPGLVCLAGTLGQADPDAMAEMLSLAWERIRTYPTTRHGSVAANVLFDVHKGYVKRRRADAPGGRGRAGGQQLEPAPSPEQILFDALEADERAALHRWAAHQVLAAARDGAISERSLRLIVRTRVEGESLGTIAEEERCRVAAVQKRRRRAEQTLALALAS